KHRACVRVGLIGEGHGLYTRFRKGSRDAARHGYHGRTFVGLKITAAAEVNGHGRGVRERKVRGVGGSGRYVAYGDEPGHRRAGHVAGCALAPEDRQDMLLETERSRRISGEGALSRSPSRAGAAEGRMVNVAAHPDRTTP